MKKLLIVIGLVASLAAVGVAVAAPMVTYGQILNHTFPTGSNTLADVTLYFYQTHVGPDNKITPADPSKDTACWSQSLNNMTAVQYQSAKGCVNNIDYIKYVFQNPLTGVGNTVLQPYTEGDVPNSQPVLMPNQFLITNTAGSKMCVVNALTDTCQ